MSSNNFLSGRNGVAFKKIIWALSVAFVSFMIIFPIYLLIKYSISDPSSINTFGRPVPLWPYHPTLRIFLYLFEDVAFWRVVWNSFAIAMLSVSLTLIMGIPAAYVIARRSFRFKSIFLIVLVSIRLFPDISSVIPVTTFFIKLNIHGTYLSIIMAHTLLALPYVIFIAMSGFSSIPRDLEDQARVMGASGLRIFTTILIPLISPSIVAGSIYTFLLSWDEFIFAHFLLGTGGSIQTLTLYLKHKLSFQPPQNILAVISVCLSLPVIIFTFIVQRHMVSGVTAGAVK